MNYRTAVILARTSKTAAGTVTIDVNIKDPISAIDVIGDFISLGTKPTDILEKLVSKVELVDGSDVLFSLTGEELSALAYYGTGFIPIHKQQWKTNYQITQMCRYFFGRKLYDPLLVFDPTRFNNPQLKITFSLATVQASVATIYLTVIAHCFDEKIPSPIGFLMSKDYYSYTLVADAHQYIDLPTDHVMRALFTLGHNWSQFVWSSIGHVKISEDNDKRIPVDLDMEHLCRTIAAQFPPYREDIHLWSSSAVVGQRFAANMNVCFSDYGLAAINTGDMAVGGYLSIGGFTTSQWQNLCVSGWIPHGVVIIPFGDLNDIDDWYDVTKVGSLRLDLTGGGYITGADSARVITHQLRRY